MGQLRLDLWGFPGGWLRAGTLSGKSGGAPGQALRQARFGLLPSPLPSPPFPCPPLPSEQTTRGGLPPPSGPRAGAWGLGAGVGVLCSPEVGGLAARRGALASPHTVSSAPLPQSWAFPSTSCCGTFVPLKSLCRLAPPPPGRRRLTWGWEGRGLRARGSWPPGRLGWALRYGGPLSERPLAAPPLRCSVHWH